MFIGNYGDKQVAFHTAAPTIGAWNLGDRCVNIEPAAGEAEGWVCIAGGTPGTWVPAALLPQGAVGDIQNAVVTLTAANVKALRATPISLVAAPGSGKVLQLISAALSLDYGSEVFTESDDNLAIKYTNGSGAAASDTIETTGFIDASADKVIQAVPVKDVIMVANAALVLHNTGDGEIAGNASNDSVVKVFITYKTLTL